MNPTPPGQAVFLHGLESPIDDNGVPTGRKARWLRERCGAVTPALDTSAAVARARYCQANREPWDADPAAVEAAFATPLARARAAITPDTRLVVGSSFGGAVLLRLLHEEPAWRGPCLFLAGAGPKLTRYKQLPPGTRAILIHGRLDAVVPLADSRQMAAGAGPGVQLWEVGYEHSLEGTLEDGTLDAAIQLLLRA